MAAGRQLTEFQPRIRSGILSLMALALCLPPSAPRHSLPECSAGGDCLLPASQLCPAAPTADPEMSEGKCVTCEVSRRERGCSLIPDPWLGEEAGSSCSLKKCFLLVQMAWVGVDRCGCGVDRGRQVRTSVGAV